MKYAQTLGLLLIAPALAAAADVTTFHNDPQRTGANTLETTLKPSNVTPFSFGKLFSQPVDGQVHAQPLYVAGVNIPGKGTHNVVFVATMHDSVYAFDADSNSGAFASPLWKQSLVNGISATAVPAADVGVGRGDIQWEIGICGTPVIDVATGTLYVSAKSKETSGDTVTYVHRLHALDIATGAEKHNGPAVVTGSAAGVGYNGLYGLSDASEGSVPFNARTAHQQSGLLLLDGRVYVAFASHEGKDPYHGWVFGFNASDLSASPTVYCSTPNADRGGIWMSGSGPAADAGGSIYFSTGNGGYDGATNMGSSVMRLSAASGLALADWFTPFNYQQLNDQDNDVGSVGVTVLPDQPGAHPRLLLAGCEDGSLYLLDRDNLGRQQGGSNSQIVQHLAGAMPNGAWTAPAYWNGRVYAAGAGDPLKAWSLDGGLLSTTPESRSGNLYGDKGASPSVSANGAADGIVWSLQADGYASSTPGILHAHDATDLSRELYNSSMMGTRDTCGQALRFTVPTVANGKVYVGTGAGPGAQGGALYVYGSKADTTPLILEGAVATNANTVTVVFNRPVEAASATTLSNYSFSGGVTASSATLGPTGRSVTLATTTLNAGIAYQVTASGVKDLAAAPHTLAPSAAIFYLVTLTGDGLLGQYWSGTTSFSGASALTRVDPVVDFDWGVGPPATGVSADTFCVRWTGFLQPATTELYTLCVTANDGTRLYVGGMKMVDAWRDQNATTYPVSVWMAAGQLYPVILEIYENSGDALARLEWSSPTIPRQAVPQLRLTSRIGYTLTDAARALRISAGSVMASGSDMARLNLVAAGASASRVDLADATRVARKAVGLDGNP